VYDLWNSAVALRFKVSTTFLSLLQKIMHTVIMHCA